VSRLWRTWSVLVLFALGTSLITPLIPLYQERLGFNDTVVTLFLGCYVLTLVPSMLSLGQLSDQVGRKRVLLGAVGVLALAQVTLTTEPGLIGLLVCRAMQGLATGAFFGTCTAFLVDAAAPSRRQFASTLGSMSIRFGLGSGPGIGGLIAQYADPGIRLSLPFRGHLVALALAALLIIWLPETVTDRTRRPLTLRLEVPRAERSVFWRVLVPSGMIFSLFDGVSLSLVPVFVVKTLHERNYALVGAAGFLVLVSGAVSQLVAPRIAPARAIGWGTICASIASIGIVAAAPTGSIALALTSVSLTGAACGLVFKGGLDLCTQIAPVAERGKLISAYLVACYLGGFSLPLLAVGVLADLSNLTVALGALSVAAGVASVWTLTVGLKSLDGLTTADEQEAGINVAEAM
jgi:predicted MFS family arabinose efflux permease